MEVHACSHSGNIRLLVPLGPGLLCKVSEYFYSFFSCCFLVWHLLIIINGHASSDQLLGPMLVKFCCVSCLCLVWVSWVGCRCVGSLCCVCVAHDVCVVLRSSSVFLVFLLCDNWRKSHHSYFITTPLLPVHNQFACLEVENEKPPLPSLPASLPCKVTQNPILTV